MTQYHNTAGWALDSSLSVEGPLSQKQSTFGKISYHQFQKPVSIQKQLAQVLHETVLGKNVYLKTFIFHSNLLCQMHAEFLQICVLILHYQQKDATNTEQGTFFAQANFLRSRFLDYQTLTAFHMTYLLDSAYIFNLPFSRIKNFKPCLPHF